MPSETARTAKGKTLDLDAYVPAFINFISNKLSKSASAVYQSRFGVNVTEWRILSLLAIEPDIAATRICQVIGFDKGPVSRTLSSMQAAGLVTIRPDKNDARSRSIALTMRGRAIHDRVIEVALKREKELLSCLSEPEKQTLVDLLRRIHANLDAVTDPEV